MGRYSADPMGDESNTNFLRARRSLEIVSAVLFLIAWFGIPPKSLPFLGGALDPHQSKTLLWFFIAAWFYLLLRYWIAVRVRVTGNGVDAHGAFVLMRKLYRSERNIAISRYAEKVVRPDNAHEYVTTPLRDVPTSVSPRSRDGKNVRLRKRDALVTFNLELAHKPPISVEAVIPFDRKTRPGIARRALWRLVTHHDELWDVCLPFIFAIAWIPFFVSEAIRNPSAWLIGLPHIQSWFVFCSGG